MPAVPQGGQAQAVIQPQPTNSGIYTIVWQPGADTTAYDIPVYSPDLTVPILEWETTAWPSWIIPTKVIGLSP